jgi:RNA polymerase sigma factor (sigma-70 family)
MLPDAHQTAQATADQADERFAVGDIDTAERLYSAAADLEQSVFQQLSRDKTRTFGIIGVSLATLLYRAARFDEARQVAEELLRCDDLLPSAQVQAEEVLSAIPVSSVLAAGGGAPPVSPSRSSDQQPRIAAHLHLVVSAAKDAQHDIADIEGLYLANREMLLYVFAEKFKIPESDAENLIGDVVLAYLRNERHVDDVRAWLMAEACKVSGKYWRVVNRHKEFDFSLSDSDREKASSYIDKLTMRLTMRRALDHLDPQHREMLWRHYFEGRTAAEAACELGITTRESERLLREALRQARIIYARLWADLHDAT